MLPMEAQMGLTAEKSLGSLFPPSQLFLLSGIPPGLHWVTEMCLSLEGLGLGFVLIH